jgi:hypothetical protein
VSMIFDRFPSRDRTEAFRAFAKDEFGLDGQVFDTDDAAQEHDPFLYRLDPPVVHIDRSDDETVERRVVDLVTAFGGTFAGT